MKKLLTLMLVFGLASIASATLSMDISGTVSVMQGDTLTITTSSNATAQEGYLAYIIIEEGGDGALSNPVVLDDAGNNASTSPYSEDEWGVGYELSAASTLNDLAAGDHFTVDWDTSDLNVGDTCVVSLWLDPDYDTAQATATLVVIPEPMTIALLGLGGLLLRRRK
jgi:hypothetical protein